MGMIRVRNLPDETLFVLDILARENHQTRESFLRDQLNKISEIRDLNIEIQEMKAQFFGEILPTLEENNKLINQLLNKF
jgi:plasmid stability protein